MTARHMATIEEMVAPKEAAVRVGVRELRNNLSRYLERVRSGDEVVVTDYGHEIARLVPLPRCGRKPSTLDRLIAEGAVTPPLKVKRPQPARGIPVSEAVSPLVSEQRR